ncbi:MAG: HNH endonuclease [Mobilicoccus sp.]|nr:HNH endonuclease [Mobilicoccus sp.]
MANWTRDEIILAADLVRQNGWRELRSTDPRVAELSALLRQQPRLADEVADPAVRSVGSVSRKTTDIATQHPDYTGKVTRGNRLDGEVLRAFITSPEAMAAVAAEIRRQWQQAASGVDPLDTGELDDLEVPEGATVMARHLRRERNQTLRRRKIEAVLRAHGALCCEACGFDFGATYGDVGEGYIEVHHIQPLHESGETVTRLADLATLCANCHRMIHRRRPWLTPDQLRELIRRAS